MPPAFSLFWIGAVMELFGGLLGLVGLLTRPVAFLPTGDGGGLLDVSCAAEPFSCPEWRRRRDLILLHIPATGLRVPGQALDQKRPCKDNLESASR